jgi:hypothetical protein
MTERYLHLTPDARNTAVNALLFAPEWQSVGSENISLKKAQ